MLDALIAFPMADWHAVAIRVGVGTRGIVPWHSGIAVATRVVGGQIGALSDSNKSAAQIWTSFKTSLLRFVILKPMTPNQNDYRFFGQFVVGHKLCAVGAARVLPV